MSEYIERKAVINKVNEIPAYFDSGDIRYGTEIAIQAIKDTPAIDVAKVVRCKDCRLATPDIMIDGWYHCDNNDMSHKPDHFCSYGERKDEE